jgi:hypothetical protein
MIAGMLLSTAMGRKIKFDIRKNAEKKRQSAGKIKVVGP